MKTIAIALTTLALVSPLVLAQDNLLTNPGLEDPLGPNNRWQANGGPPNVFERTDEQAFSGTWSGKVSNRTQQWHGVFYGLSADGLFGDGGAFEISVMAMTDDPGGQQNVRLILQINDEREACPAELPIGIEWCFCGVVVSPTDNSCLFGADSKLSVGSSWVQLEWAGIIEFVGEVSYYMFQIDTQEGEPFPDLYVDEAYMSVEGLFRDRFEFQ